MLGYDGDIDEVFLSMEADLLKAQQALNQSS
jgi:hypothetical protein